MKQIRSLSPKEIEAFNAALESLVQPSIYYDSVATETARSFCRQQTSSRVTISLKRGQKIVREGDTITPEVLSQIAAIRSYSHSTRQVNRFFGLLALISALFWVAWKFIQHNQVGTRLALSAEKTFALVRFYRHRPDGFDGDIFPHRRIYRRAESESAAQRPDALGVCDSVCVRKPC